METIPQWAKDLIDSQNELKKRIEQLQQSNDVPVDDVPDKGISESMKAYLQQEQNRLK